MGRPAAGPVSTFPPALKEAILRLRKLHPGWGPDPPLTARKHRCLTICFDPDTTALLCQPEGSEETIQLPAQSLTKAELMGELAVLQALPIYQLALPFSLEAWRQLAYTHILTSTTL